MSPIVAHFSSAQLRVHWDACGSDFTATAAAPAARRARATGIGD